jgi:hypothetical protein
MEANSPIWLPVLIHSGFFRSLMMRFASLWMVGALVVWSSSAVFAQGFGTLTGQFIYDGTAPAPAKLMINKDQAVCGKEMLVDEELVVGADGGIANVVVTYYLKLGAKAPAGDPAVLAKLPAQVRCDNLNCRFSPHVVVLFAGKQQLVLGNKDPVAHNVKGDTLKNPPFNPLLPALQDLALKETAFSKAESLPVPLSCSIHPWMRGKLVAVDHPFVGVSDATGKFTITGIPAGKHTFRAWQEKSGYVVTVNEGGSAKTWTQGRFEVDIKAGGSTDLGVVKVSPKNFEGK